MKEIYLFKRLSNIGRRLLCTHQGNVCVAIAQALEVAKPLWGQHLALLFPYNQGVICNPSLCAGLWHHVLAQIFAIGGSRNTRSKGAPGQGGNCSRFHGRKVISTFGSNRALFLRISSADLRALSISHRRSAPRERASNPKAPVPAKRSRTCAFSKGFPNRPEASTLNKFSRTRSVVGRKCAEGSPLPTEAKALPRCVPAIILKISAGI